MNIRQTKSLIREVSPGKFAIGNNIFDPALEIDSESKTASVGGTEVLFPDSLVNLSGVSLDYQTAELGTVQFEVKPTVSGVPVLLSGESQAGTTINEAENLAKKWAIILG
jgi:hypothetical protein